MTQSQCENEEKKRREMFGICVIRLGICIKRNSIHKQRMDRVLKDSFTKDFKKIEFRNNNGTRINNVFHMEKQNERKEIMKGE